MKGYWKRMVPAGICLLACVAAGCAGAGHRAGIAGLLLGMKHDEQAKSAQLRRETAEFRQAKDALFAAGGRLEPVDKARARALFGEPVSVFKRDGRDVWAYKPASSDWFQGEKIFLTFDERGLLAGAEYQPS